MLVPLIILSAGSILAGFLFKDLFINIEDNYYFWKDSIMFLKPLSTQHPPLFIIMVTPILVVLSIPISYYLFIKNNKLIVAIVDSNKPIYNLLLNKWYFDEFYEYIFIKPSKKIGLFFWKFVDLQIIDRFGPDGVSKLIKSFSIRAKKFQTGYIYQYAFIMLLGFSAILTFLILK